jgi:membrane protein DedA with SNARE-associated domain
MWGGGLMIVGYELGSRWESVANKAKRIDLVIAALIVLVILAIVIRFMLRRRRERETAVAQKNPGAAVD